MALSLSGITVRTVMSQLVQLGTAYGAPIPDALTDTINRLEHVATTAAAPQTVRGGLAAAIVAAAEDGRDVLEDTDVRRHIAADALARNYPRDEVETILEARRVAALAQHAPELVATWQPMIEAAQSTLAAARKALPGIDQMGAGDIGALRPGQLKTWGEAREARLLVVHIAKAWGLLVIAAELARVTDATRPLTITDASLTELDAIPRGAKVDDVVVSGLALSLPTPAQFAQRVARIERERADRQASRQEAERTAMRTLPPTGVMRVTPFGAEQAV